MNSPLVSPFSTKVVGVTFIPTYPYNLQALQDEWGEGHHEEPLTAILVRDPSNTHDPNAVQVHVPALGDYAMIGHLPRAIAARLAPELDAGGIWDAGVTEVLITPGHEDRPGIAIRLKRITHQGGATDG